MRTKALLLTTILMTAAACAPPQEDVRFPEGRRTFGPQRTDVDLGLNEAGPRTEPLAWEAETSSAIFFRLTENLIALNQEQAQVDSPLRTWIRSWWGERPVEKTPFAAGPYAELVLQRAEDSSLPLLRETIERIDREKRTLAETLAATKPPEVRSGASLEKQAESTLQFVADFEKKASAMDLQPAFKKALIAELAKERARLGGVLKKALSDLRSAKTLTRTLNVLEALLKSENIEVDSSLRRSLREGRQLARSADAVRDEKTALSLLVDVWIYLSPSQRREIFEPINPDLYRYLLEQPEQNLRCLQGASCSSLITLIARTFVILPKIREYGVEKIRAKVNKEASGYVLETLGRETRKQIASIGKLMGEVLVKRVDDRLAELRALNKDFRGELRKRLTKWAADGAGVSLIAERMTPARVRADLKPGSLKVDFVPMEKADLESEGTLAGLASAVTSQGWLKPDQARAWSLAEFNRIADMNATERPATAKDHAEILRGLSLLTVPLRDYERSTFEDLFGFANAQQLFPGLEADELDQPLFPKDALFALSLSKLGDYLKLITAPGTPVFLLDLDGRAIWASDYDFNAATSPAVMAGVVDPGHSSQARVVRSANVARYLIGISEFLRVTANLERSNSRYLREPQNGEIPMVQLQEARKKLKLLAVALGNYLSNQLRRSDGLIEASVTLNGQHPRGEAPSLTDQVLAMRALAESSQTLGVDIYRWEAMDVLAAMNARLYRRELGFYTDTLGVSRRPALPTLIEALRALSAIEPHLPDARRGQVTAIKNAWMARVNELVR